MVAAAFLVDRRTEQKVCYGGRKIKKVAIVGFFARWKYEDVNDG
jgi:hypothetical protein